MIDFILGWLCIGLIVVLFIVSTEELEEFISKENENFWYTLLAVILWPYLLYLKITD